MKIKTYLYLKNLEITFYDNGVLNPKAVVYAKGKTIGGGGAFEGEFSLHFNLSDEESDAIKAMFQKRCAEVADDIN